jgi:hypothetical protein
MDGNISAGLEAQTYPLAINLEHRDFEHGLESLVASNNDRFLCLP